MRKFTRVEFIEPYLEVSLHTQACQQVTTITLATRNISAGGLSLLHSNYIYPGTRIITNLTKVSGKKQKITGVVRRCEHRGGVVHEIGIQFDRVIRLHEYVQSDFFQRVLSHDQIEAEAIQGNIMAIGPCIDQHIHDIISKTNAQITYASNSEEVIDQALTDIDLIIIAMDAGDMNGAELTRRLRLDGYLRPIILLGDHSKQIQKKQILLSQADLFISFPIDPRYLLRSLAEYLLTDWTVDQLMRARKAHNSDGAEVLTDQLSMLGSMLETQFNTEDAVKAYITLATIRNLAAILGLVTLQSVSHQICDEIADKGFIEGHSVTIKEVIGACKSPLANTI